MSYRVSPQALAQLQADPNRIREWMRLPESDDSLPRSAVAGFGASSATSAGHLRPSICRGVGALPPLSVLATCQTATVGAVSWRSC